MSSDHETRRASPHPDQLLRDLANSRALVRDCQCHQSAGSYTAAVVVFQSAGEFSRRCSGPPWGWNPHWHSLVLEGGFSRDGRFVHVPTVDLAKMSGCFRQRVIAFFLDRKLLNEWLAKSMVEWEHSGFSVVGSVHLLITGAPR